MNQININKIKHNFPEYLSRAETGESFIITRDGKPVFELKYIEKKNDGKLLTSDRKISAKSIFGMLRHRAPDIPVSIEDMETVIKQRRYKRAVK